MLAAWNATFLTRRAKHDHWVSAYLLFVWSEPVHWHLNLLISVRRLLASTSSQAFIFLSYSNCNLFCGDFAPTFCTPTNYQRFFTPVRRPIKLVAFASFTRSTAFRSLPQKLEPAGLAVLLAFIAI